MAFGLFSENKVDVWMIKNTIKTNQIDMGVCFFEGRQYSKTIFVPKLHFSHQFAGL